jgi:hypothetical protein
MSTTYLDKVLNIPIVDKFIGSVPGGNLAMGIYDYARDTTGGATGKPALPDDNTIRAWVQNFFTTHYGYPATGSFLAGEVKSFKDIALANQDPATVFGSYWDVASNWEKAGLKKPDGPSGNFGNNSNGLNTNTILLAGGIAALLVLVVTIVLVLKK